MSTDLDRAAPDSDPRPEMYTVDGFMPPDVLESAVEWLRRNPSHPGEDLAGILERFNLGVPEAAARLGVESADLADVLEGRSPMTVDLALRLEAAGWDTAEGWSAGRLTTMSPRSGGAARGRHRKRPVPSLCRRECLPRRQPRRSEQPRLNSGSAPAGAEARRDEGGKDALDALVEGRADGSRRPQTFTARCQRSWGRSPLNHRYGSGNRGEPPRYGCASNRSPRPSMRGSASRIKLRVKRTASCLRMGT